MSGKLAARPEVNDPSVGKTNHIGSPNHQIQSNHTGSSRLTLLHVFDNNSNRYFLVDTGSALSIIPPTRSDRTRQGNQQLVAANGTPIKSYGTRRLELMLGRQVYTWNFIVADVTQPIIGGDFLRSHSLLVDLARERVIRSDNYKVITGTASPRTSPKIASLSVKDSFASLLHSRPALTTPTFSNPSPKHGVLHRIPTTGFPVHSQARRLSPEKLGVAKEEFETLEKLGIVRRSNSPYSSPLHIAPKPGGGMEAMRRLPKT